MDWQQQAALRTITGAFLNTLPGPAVVFFLSPTGDPEEFLVEAELADSGSTIGTIRRKGARWDVRQYGTNIGRARDTQAALWACARAYLHGESVRRHLIGEDFQAVTPASAAGADPGLPEWLARVLDWVHINNCADHLHCDQDLVCQECGARLREVEADDSLAILARAALEHTRTCPNGLGVALERRTANSATTGDEAYGSPVVIRESLHVQLQEHFDTHEIPYRGPSGVPLRYEVNGVLCSPGEAADTFLPGGFKRNHDKPVRKPLG